MISREIYKASLSLTYSGKMTKSYLVLLFYYLEN